MNKEPKKMWRCANDIMAYCSGEPEWKDPPKELTCDRGLHYEDIEGTCTCDPHKCRKHLTYTEMLEAGLKKIGARAPKKERVK